MTETLVDKLKWVITEEYLRELLLAKTRVARAQSEVADLQQRYDTFLDRLNDEPD
jgi:hypothetical protein